MRKRCVVLLGRAGAGKTTVASCLVRHDLLSPNEVPFGPATRGVRHETVEFMWENDLYRVTVVDTAVISDGQDIDRFVQCIRENKLRVDLILFVVRKGRLTRDEMMVFSYMRKRRPLAILGFPKDITPISALVITGCEDDDTTVREELVREFKVHPHSREIASQMGMGIYPVGFPPLREMIPALRDVYLSDMLEDRDTLRELIVRVNADRERGKWQCDE